METGTIKRADESAYIYRIDRADRIIFINNAWLSFAKENQASELTPATVIGQPLDRFTSGWETKHLYEIIYKRVRESGQKISFTFRCDSPWFKRTLRMQISHMENGGLEFTVTERDIEKRPWCSVLDHTIEHSPGFIAICSWCKRIKVNENHWTEMENVLDIRGAFLGPPPA